jgi:putative molybdopterin biosynthesis protein
LLGSDDLWQFTFHMTSIPAGQKIRALRLARGIKQGVLARQAGISRQALASIEAGVYLPGVTVAIKIAGLLNDSVENLFGAEGEGHVEATWKGARGEATAGRRTHQTVSLARVAGRLIAMPRARAVLQLSGASGTLERLESHGRADVATMRSPSEIEATLVIAGCDPAVAILRDHLARCAPSVAVIPIPSSSRGALIALAEERAHVAGIHLRDPASGEYNAGAVRIGLGRKRVKIVNFARWELGLASRRNNPIRNLEALVRGRARLMNREKGSGARLVLDDELSRQHVKRASIKGYDEIRPGHLEVAAAISEGAADAGVTIKMAAEAYGLEFVTWNEERYDLIIPEREIDTVPVHAMMQALNSSRLAHEIAAFCDYDTTEMGKVG